MAPPGGWRQHLIRDNPLCGPSGLERRRRSQSPAVDGMGLGSARVLEAKFSGCDAHVGDRV